MEPDNWATTTESFTLGCLGCENHLLQNRRLPYAQAEETPALDRLYHSVEYAGRCLYKTASQHQMELPDFRGPTGD